MVGVAAIAVAVGFSVGVGLMSAAAVLAIVGVAAAAVAVGFIVGVAPRSEVAVGFMVGVKVMGAVLVTTIVGVAGICVAAVVAVASAVGVEPSFEVTVNISALETASGPGLATVMVTTPACVATPVAVRRIDEVKVVASGVPSHNTWAPFTKWLPLTCKANDPSGTVLGTSARRLGIGLRTVTAAVAVFAGLALLVALSVTVVPANPTGGRYRPYGLTKPTARLPPGTPLAAHFTALVGTPSAYAVSFTRVRTRTELVDGDTVKT